MSDSSGSSSCALKSSPPAPASVHRPSSMTSSKDDLAGKDWLPKKDSSGALVGVGSLGSGSAFAKYVRKDSSQQQQRSSSEPSPSATTTGAPIESKTSSGEPETMAGSDSQPSFTNTHFNNHAMHTTSKPTLKQHPSAPSLSDLQHHLAAQQQQLHQHQHHHHHHHHHSHSQSHSHSHALTERHSSRPESSGRSELLAGDDNDGDDEGHGAMSSSSDSENTHSKGNNSGSGTLKGAGGSSGTSSGKKRFKGASSEEPKSKKQRLIWTPELHARFLAAVNHLGVKNAVPKTILQLMNVEGMTRENVASHLQKYRLYLKRLAGLPANVPLSADTLQQVQTVQQALQQQVQAGFQTSHTLQLAAAGGMPLSLAGIPAVSLAGNYQDLVSQLMAANAAGGAGAPSTSAAATQAGGGGGGLTELQAGTLAALQRSQLVGVLPGLLPIGFTPLSMAGFGGLNSAALLGGAGGLGMVGQVSLANSGLMLQGNNVLAAQLNGASNGNQ